MDGLWCHSKHKILSFAYSFIHSLIKYNLLCKVWISDCPMTSCSLAPFFLIRENYYPDSLETCEFSKSLHYLSSATYSLRNYMKHSFEIVFLISFIINSRGSLFPAHTKTQALKSVYTQAQAHSQARFLLNQPN